MKTMIKYLIITVTAICLITNTNANDKGTSFITGVGTSHFEAHRMAVNAANASRMKIRQQISRRSNDGLWHVILKVNP
jgi:hypothetical protein